VQEILCTVQTKLANCSYEICPFDTDLQFPNNVPAA